MKKFIQFVMAIGLLLGLGYLAIRLAGPEDKKITETAPAPAPIVVDEFKDLQVPNRTVNVSELTKHNQASDCWMAVHGIVFDATGFLSKPNLARQVFVSRCGQDATIAVDASSLSPFTTDSESARASLGSAVIGRYDETQADVPAVSPIVPSVISPVVEVTSTATVPAADSTTASAAATTVQN